MPPARPHKTSAAYSAMPVASLLAFVWTLGLQSVIAYLFLARVHGEHSGDNRSQMSSRWSTRAIYCGRGTQSFSAWRNSRNRGIPKRGTTSNGSPCIPHASRRPSLGHPKYRSVITPAFVRLIGISSALHDIGKVGIEDSVLLKPGILTATERFRMQLHAEVGAECIREIERRLGRSNFLEMAREIAHSHHEHWDGNGYPEVSPASGFRWRLGSWPLPMCTTPCPFAASTRNPSRTMNAWRSFAKRQADSSIPTWCRSS